MQKILDGRLPKLIAFDLDYTLWDLWIDTHISGPLRRDGKAVNEIEDQFGERISFYPEVPEVPEILRQLKAREDVTIAAASRTHTPDLARDALRLMLLPETDDKDGPLKSSIEYFDEMEIYPGSKMAHFKELHKRTGIPYEEMLFFDDESRNREVSSLGVTFYLIKTGTDMKAVNKGIEKWRALNVDVPDASVEFSEN